MKLISNDFGQGKDIPKEFTCQGTDTSPHLNWSGWPSGTKSFALSVNDPDTQVGNWVHWLVYNIPPDTHGFARGTYKGLQLTNDFGKKDYGGPCPPSGKHRYYFTIYALDVTDLGGGVTKQNFAEKVGAHTIAKAELVGLYEKR